MADDGKYGSLGRSPSLPPPTLQAQRVNTVSREYTAFGGNTLHASVDSPVLQREMSALNEHIVDPPEARHDAEAFFNAPTLPPHAQIRHIIDHYGNHDHYNKQARNAHYEGVPGGYQNPQGHAFLSEMVSKREMVCREMAVMSHIHLATLGIRTEVVSASRNKSSGGTSRHAFLRTPSGAIIDPTHHKIGRPGGHISQRYTIDAQSQVLVEPSNPVRAEHQQTIMSRLFED